MSKKIKGSIAVVVVVLFLGWYFLIKESDYTINFNVKTATGTISQGIEEWATLQNNNNKERYTILEKRNYDFIKQQCIKGKDTYLYSWEMKSINDSTTRVSVSIKDVNNSFYNKLTAPFMATPFRAEQIEKIKTFKQGLQDHIDNFKIKIDGEGNTPEIHVAYIELQSVMQEKAQTMITNDPDVVGYLTRNKIKILGNRPYLEITDWNQDKETVRFNYCFPIPKSTKYIPDERVKFKTIPSMKGLKATYFGNYRTSDRAWFSLLDYAKKNNIQLQSNVLEHFLANPFNGGNELEWETKILIPFASK